MERSKKLEFIHANLVNVVRSCGNKNCKCITKGKKHISLYLTTTRKDGVRKMIYIPKKLEEEAKQMVTRYFKIRDIIKTVSDINLKRVLSKKQQCLEE
jgi:intergrase/recombinase